MSHSKLILSDNMDSQYSCLFLCPALSDGEMVEKKMLLLLRRTHLSKETSNIHCKDSSHLYFCRVPCLIILRYNLRCFYSNPESEAHADLLILGMISAIETSKSKNVFSVTLKNVFYYSEYSIKYYVNISEAEA